MERLNALAHQRARSSTAPIRVATRKPGGDDVPMQEDKEDFYSSSAFGRAVRFSDNIGPDKLKGISRYDEYPDGTDFSDAYLDPDCEAVGRYVRACAELEIAIYRARSELDIDTDMTFAVAEHRHKTDKCIKALRELAQALNDTSRARLLALLDSAEQWLQLRHGVVHGIYRKNHRTGQHEGRRFVLNKDTRQYVLVREPYDRDNLMLAMTRASNTAAEIFDGVADWRAQIVSAERRRIQALGPPHPLRIEGEEDGTATLHALAHHSTATVCGRDASGMRSHHDVVFEWTKRKLQCPECQRLIGV